MKSFSFAKILVACSVLCLALPVACGDSEENPTPNPNAGGESNGGSGSDGGAPVMMDGGAAGAPMTLPPGISLMPSTIQCGGDCESARVGLGPTMSYYIDPCCGDGDVCGLSTTFLATAGAMFTETCQPKDQPGELDEACPAPDPAMIPAGGMTVTLDAFPGCCRPSGVCGVAVNAATAGGGILPLGDLGLGCVDAEPFFPGEDPVPCGEGVGGSGAGGSGAGGANTGGAPVAAGGDGVGGANAGSGGGG